VSETLAVALIGAVAAVTAALSTALFHSRDQLREDLLTDRRDLRAELERLTVENARLRKELERAAEDVDAHRHLRPDGRDASNAG